MFISVAVQVEKAFKALDEAGKKQVPFAAARAMTALAQLSVRDLQALMRKNFDRPTPYTLNAFYAKPAKRGDPTASVNSRDFAGKGRPAWKYLQTEALGGSRVMKGFEQKLGIVSDGQYAVPTASTPLDAFGNLRRGMLTQILSRLSISGDQSVSIRTSTKLRKRKATVAASGHRGEYFIAHEDGKPTGRPLGLYKLVGPGQVVKLLSFQVGAPRYAPRIDVAGSIEATVQKHAPFELAKALTQALATAKR